MLNGEVINKIIKFLQGMFIGFKEITITPINNFIYNISVTSYGGYNLINIINITGLCYLENNCNMQMTNNTVISMFAFSGNIANN